ncbi:MAG: carcinine hydrolase/isopenicillin-N N-acyltransferase family protein, partial [Bacteroidota bacterium]
MLIGTAWKKAIVVVLLVLLSASGSAQESVAELQFRQPLLSEADAFRTLQSLVKVKGMDGLYLMTHYGDREKLFQEENQNLIDDPFINDRSRYCSVFSTRTADAVLMGRNWDNENVGSIIVSFYHPPDGYASISFSRAVDLGFGKGVDLLELASVEPGRKLLLAPFYAMDGINEHGLAVAVAGDEESIVQARSDREPVFVSYLIRRMLDRTRTTEEAVQLARGCAPFLLDRNTLVAHLLIVDSSGSSVVLEYVDDEWRETSGEASWQVMSTKRVHEVADSALREKCWRYRTMSEALEAEGGNVDWKASMNILRDVEQKGTTWSIVYSASTRDVYFSVYK